MPVTWITHKNRKILYVDYRGLLTNDDLLYNLQMEEEIYKSAHSKILSLNDYRDTFLSKTFMNEVITMGKQYEDKLLRSSILGITGLKKLLLNSYVSLTGQQVRAFNEEAIAKDYLVNYSA